MKYGTLLILLFFTIPLTAQQTATVVLQQHNLAIGGEKNIAAAHSIYALAACSGPNGNYRTEIQSAGDSLTLFRQVRAGKPDYTGIVNGNTSWTMGPAPAAAGKKEAFAWRSHELQWIAIRPGSRFTGPVMAGNETFDGKAAIKLTATDELNNKAQLFFDSHTKLLLGFIIVSPFGEENETIRLVIKEWKRVGKLLLPGKVVFTDKSGDFTLNFHTIRLNSVDRKNFAIPPAISAANKLLELHTLQRTAHFNRDARLLVSIMSDDFTEVSKGKVSHPKKEDMVKRFQTYFDAVTFIEWDDIMPPVIKLSDDATLAYMTVSKRVRLLTKEGKEEATTYAWTSTFQQINGKWLMTGITSTEKAVD